MITIPPEQLLGSPLIRSKTSHLEIFSVFLLKTTFNLVILTSTPNSAYDLYLANEVPHKFVVLGQLALEQRIVIYLYNVEMLDQPSSC